MKIQHLCAFATSATLSTAAWANFPKTRLFWWCCVFRSLLDTQFGFSWTAGTVGPGHPDRLSWTRAI